MSDGTPANAQDFHFGASVHSSDGRHVGSLRRLIVDGESLHVHGIAIQESAGFSRRFFGGRGLIEDDIAVPIAVIATVTHERIDLTVPVHDLHRLPPYISYQMRGEGGPSGPLGYVVAGYGGSAGMVPALDEIHLIAPGEVEVVSGEKIFIDDGSVELGEVVDVLLDDGELLGVVVRPRRFFTEDVVLQVRFLHRLEAGHLDASLSSEQLQGLTPFHPSVD